MTTLRLDGGHPADYGNPAWVAGDLDDLPAGKYSPDQPRVPAGDAAGGQFASGDPAVAHEAAFRRFIAGAQARIDAIAELGRQTPRPLAFTRKDGHGQMLVTMDPRKPGAWRVTYIMEDGTPSGHTEADTFADAISEVYQSGMVDWDALRKTMGKKYSPDQARVPAGDPSGGEFANEGRSARDRGASLVRIVPPHGDSYDAMEKHAEVAAERSASRQPDDQEALDTYQSIRWIQINDPLRAGQTLPDQYEGGATPGPAADASRIDRLMTSEGGAPFDAYLYRGVHSDNVFPESMPVGYLFTDKGYMSTTTDKDSAMSFAFPGGGKPAKTIVVIKAPKGQPSIWMDYEVLLPRGTTLRVTMDGHDRASGARVINAEIVR